MIYICKNLNYRFLRHVFSFAKLNICNKIDYKPHLQ
nr:MAG TPA: hypothetical protein [Caudoviricetes sp.]